jgi:hypothetical protein
MVEGKVSSGASFVRVLIPFMRLHPADLMISQRPHLSIANLEIRILMYKFWENTNVQATVKCE